MAPPSLHGDGKGGKSFRLEAAPEDGACVANLPVTVDLGRQGSGGDVEVGEVDVVDRQVGQVPRVDVCAQVAGLPVECAGAILGEGRADQRGRGGGCACPGSPRRGGGRRPGEKFRYR